MPSAASLVISILATRSTAGAISGSDGSPVIMSGTCRRGTTSEWPRCQAAMSRKATQVSSS